MVSNTCVYLHHIEKFKHDFLLQSHASNRKQLWRDNLKINSDKPIKSGMNDSWGFFGGVFLFCFVFLLLREHFYLNMCYFGEWVVSYSSADPGPFFRGHWREILDMKPKFCKYTLSKCNIDKILTVIEEIQQSMYYSFLLFFKFWVDSIMICMIFFLSLCLNSWSWCMTAYAEMVKWSLDSEGGTRMDHLTGI